MRPLDTFHTLDHEPRTLFPLGRQVITSGLLHQLTADDNAALGVLLARHQRGDWGSLDPDDRAANDRAVTDGGRLLSAYHLPSGTKVWIITEWDRSATTVLRPEDY